MCARLHFVIILGARRISPMRPSSRMWREGSELMNRRTGTSSTQPQFVFFPCASMNMDANCMRLILFAFMVTQIAAVKSFQARTLWSDATFTWVSTYNKTFLSIRAKGPNRNPRRINVFTSTQGADNNLGCVELHAPPKSHLAQVFRSPMQNFLMLGEGHDDDDHHHHNHHHLHQAQILDSPPRTVRTIFRG